MRSLVFQLATTESASIKCMAEFRSLLAGVLTVMELTTCLHGFSK